mgnify:CR=1|tara:strand:- start:4 stop:891 length:888 start_codon:yes stop_codon:yes gene_type:complete
MERPSDSINTGGSDSSFENLYIYGKLNYDFDKDDITFGNATFTGDINLDEITCRNANVTGVATVTSALYVQGKLFDGDGDFGTAGQLLSSDGTDTVWIDANTTSVANSINVGTNLNSTNADQFVTFVENNSGNNPIRVDAGIKYNPSTNRLTAGSYAGDGSALTGIEAFVTGMIILWSGAADAIPSGFVLCDGNNNTPNLSGRFVVGYDASNGDYDVNDTGGAENVTLSIAQIPNHKHTTSFDGHKFFPGDGSTSVSYGGAGGYPATVFSMDNTGGGQSHENRPPYYALCYIMKT